jgi:hypothetical protein
MCSLVNLSLHSSFLESHMEEISIHELEFSIQQNPEKILQKAKLHKLSRKDIGLLKLILCSGLYLNLAIPDEANYSRKPMDLVYHTRTKRFVFMHPASIYHLKPELLLPHIMEKDREEEETLGNLHQKVQMTELACFLECLETNKPYLMNVFKVPAAPVCLLFGNSSKGY